MADNKSNKSEPEEKAVFLKTTAALDLERREEDERLTPAERRERDKSQGRDFTGDGNDTSAYVGVSAEYMNYASPGDRPYRAGEDSALGRLEDQLTSGAAVAAPVDPVSNQTDGGGSTVPLVYAEFSGEDFTNRVVTAEEAKAESDRLNPEVENKEVPAPKVAAAPAKTGK